MQVWWKVLKNDLRMFWKSFWNVLFIYEKFWKKSEVDNLKNSPFKEVWKVFRTSFSARLKFNQIKVFFWKFLHYHKIDAFIDKCLKNHLKMRSFDWLKKLLKFYKKNMKIWSFCEKRMKKVVLMGVEPMTKGCTTWQKELMGKQTTTRPTRLRC